VPASGVYSCSESLLQRRLLIILKQCVSTSITASTATAYSDLLALLRELIGRDSGCTTILLVALLYTERLCFVVRTVAVAALQC
jgi:hypothetical protein